MCIYYIANEDVEKAHQLLSSSYTESRYIPPGDDWPPYHPKHYTLLTIVHHERKCTEFEVIDTVKIANAKNTICRSFQSFSNIHDKAAKNICDLFVHFEEPESHPYVFLIEGAPGIGKTTLSKQIALQWAEDSVLHGKQLLFLLCMGDPRIKNIKDIPSLVKYFCQSNDLTEKITNWLIETNGKYLAIVLDGYDEVGEDNKSHFIHTDIIGRRQLVQSALVITSRPAASTHLHDTVDCRVEVLGFTKENRNKFIEDALHEVPNKIEQLEDILKFNPILDSLCYIPLNMSILLCLTMEADNIEVFGNQTSLYQKFIIMTITRCITKTKGEAPKNISTLKDLPQPHYQVIKELAKFSFLGMQRDQLVFTLSEVNKVCPDLTPDNWYGYGLLKQSCYFEPQGACVCDSFHFLHFSIQEYLAAYHIASLPHKKLLGLLKRTFWNVHFINTWEMYVGITGGQQLAFKHFLSGKYFSLWPKTTSISSKIQCDKIKCLHLLRCLAETDHDMHSTIQNIFKDGIIDLSRNSLSPNDVRTLINLLIKSPNKQWEKLVLSNCGLNEEHYNVFWEMNSLHKTHAEVTINVIDISHNCNMHWETLKLMCTSLKCWHIDKVVLSIDSLLGTKTASLEREFQNKLSQQLNRLQKCSSHVCKLFFVYIAEQSKVIAVRLLEIYDSNNRKYIQNHVKCHQLTGYKMNDYLIKNLVKFAEHRPLCTKFVYITSIHAKEIASTLAENFNKLQFDGFYFHSTNIVNEFKTSSTKHGQGVEHNLQVVDACEIALFLHTIESPSPLTTLEMSKVNLNNKRAMEVAKHLSTCIKNLTLTNCNLQFVGLMTIINTLIRNNVCLQLFNLGGNKIENEVASEIAIMLSNSTKIQQLDVSNCHLQTEGAIKIAKALQKFSSLKVYNMSHNSIGDKAADSIAAVLSCNNKLQQFKLNNNNLQTNSTSKIIGALHRLSLKVFSMGCNKIDSGAAEDVAVLLSHSTNLQELDLSNSDLQSEGTLKIANALLKISSLRVFNIEKCNINNEAADIIAVVFSCNGKLQQVNLNSCNLQPEGSIKIVKGLQKTVHLRVFNIGSNIVGDEVANDIAAILLHNSQLQQLDLSHGNFQTTSVMKFAKSMWKTSSLRIFRISGNNIGKEAASEVAAVLSHNDNLQQLDLNNCNLQTDGAIMITKALQKISSLQALFIGSNNIDDEAADSIAVAIRHNTKLQQLDLFGNNFQIEGSLAITNALQNTSYLKVFKMETMI